MHINSSNCDTLSKVKAPAIETTRRARKKKKNISKEGKEKQKKFL